MAFHKGTARASEHLLACSGFSSGRKAGRKLGKALHTAAISPMASKEMQQSQGAATHQPPSATRSCLCLGDQLLWAQTPKPLTEKLPPSRSALWLREAPGAGPGAGTHQIHPLEVLSQTITAVSPNTLCSFTRERGLGGSSCLLKYRKAGSDHNLFFLCYQFYQILIFRGFTQKIPMNKICQP